MESNIDDKKMDERDIFLNEPSIKLNKYQLSSEDPVTCIIEMNLNDMIKDVNDVETLFHVATEKFDHSPSLVNISKVHKKRFDVSIAFGDNRCSWCQSFLKFIEKEMNVNMLNCGPCENFIKNQF